MIPLISVITPVFNGQEYIPRCYRNLLEQTYENWEWIVVDDGSTDNTFDLLGNICKKDPRVRFFVLEENKGRGFARNEALSHIRGEYVAIWDIDDLHTEKHLAEAVSRLNDGFDYYAGAAFLVNEESIITGRRVADAHNLIHPALVIKAYCFRENKYAVNKTVGGIGEDYFILLRLLYSYSGFLDERPTTYYFEFADLNITKSLHSKLIQIKTFIYFKNIPLRTRLATIIKGIVFAFLLALLHLFGDNFYKKFIKYRKSDVNDKPSRDLLNFEAKYKLRRGSSGDDVA